MGLATGTSVPDDANCCRVSVDRTCKCVPKLLMVTLMALMQSFPVRADQTSLVFPPVDRMRVVTMGSEPRTLPEGRAMPVADHYGHSEHYWHSDARRHDAPVHDDPAGAAPVPRGATDGRRDREASEVGYGERAPGDTGDVRQADDADQVDDASQVDDAGRADDAPQADIAGDLAVGEQRAAPTQEQLAREAERALDMFLRDQKILFLKGETEFELTLIHAMDTQHNARIGGVVVPTLESNSSTLSFRVRYALTNNLEINLSLPLSRSDADYKFLYLQNPSGAIEDSHDAGVGDARLGFRYQVYRELGLRPDIALSFDYESDSGAEGVGSGDHALGVKSTFVKTIDPAVFYVEFGYEHTFPDRELDRGDALMAQFGTGFSLNDRVSYNLQFGLQVIEETTLDGRAITGTALDVANLQLGVTTRLARSVYIEPFLSLGLSDDANDVSFGIRIPF